eukprot:TRINITY_DN3065_c0_g1_i2.p1 TRINITY_DN3065_c0_g1~~TRINITY_DN3065_c0_g1_i2.p1  ORF type:complete len:672 (-),score=103.76 TRINITY_DN3065_c0_g1_i2:10-2004(-)
MPHPKTDPEGLYAFLGVSSTATETEIRHAYRRLAEIYHPDAHAALPERERAIAAETFKQIGTMYETLIDPRKRRAYDCLGREGVDALALVPADTELNELRLALEFVNKRDKLRHVYQQVGSAASITAELDLSDYIPQPPPPRAQAPAPEPSSPPTTWSSVANKPVPTTVSSDEPRTPPPPAAFPAPSSSGTPIVVLDNNHVVVKQIRKNWNEVLQWCQQGLALGVGDAQTPYDSVSGGGAVFRMLHAKQRFQTPLGEDTCLVVATTLGGNDQGDLKLRLWQTWSNFCRTCVAACLSGGLPRFTFKGEFQWSFLSLWVKLRQVGWDFQTLVLSCCKNLTTSSQLIFRAAFTRLSPYEPQWKVRLKFWKDRKAAFSVFVLGCVSRADLGLGIRYAREFNDSDRSVQTELSFNPLAFPYAVSNSTFPLQSLQWGYTINQRVSRLNWLSLGLSVRPYGVFVELGFLRHNHRLTLPIRVYRIATARSVGMAAGVPLLATILVKTLVVTPVTILQRRGEILRNRNAKIHRIRAAREQALALQSIMAETVERKRAEEEAVHGGGLIVVNARYGCLHPPLTLPENTEDLVIDVTVPLQSRVSKSTLLLLEGTKSDLDGFCDVDPCQDLPKSLYVRYSFQGLLHEVEVADDEPLRLPQEAHIINRKEEEDDDE